VRTRLRLEDVTARTLAMETKDLHFTQGVAKEKQRYLDRVPRRAGQTRYGGIPAMFSKLQ
jgi:hypothetical protein